MKLTHVPRENRKPHRGVKKPPDDLSIGIKPRAVGNVAEPRIQLMQRSLGNATFSRLVAAQDPVVLNKAPAAKEAGVGDLVSVPGKLMAEGEDLVNLVLSELEKLMPAPQASGLAKAVAEAMKGMKPSSGGGGSGFISPDDLAKLLPALFPPQVDLPGLAAEGLEIGKEIAAALAKLFPGGQASGIGELVAEALGKLEGAAQQGGIGGLFPGVGEVPGAAGSGPGVDVGQLGEEGLDLAKQILEALAKIMPLQEASAIAQQVAAALGKLQASRKGGDGGGIFSRIGEILGTAGPGGEVDLGQLGAEGLDLIKLIVDAIGKMASGGEPEAGGSMFAGLGDLVAGLGAPGGATAPAGKLTPAEVASARSFYARRPDLYTPDVIKQIQEKLGVPGTGVMDDATILAVADFQAANPPLKVDGKAGPRTLPVEFPVGLSEKANADTYVAGAKKVQTEWAALATGDDRAKALGKIVNERLAAAGVPAVKQVVKDLGADSGQFDFQTWTLALGQGPFSKDAVTDAEAADIAGTVYHESRHAEQWFKMAQMRAGQGRSAAQIAAELSIPDDIAAKAAASPLKKGTLEAVEAQGWYESVYGTGAARRDFILTDVDQKDAALKKAREADEKLHTAATAAALAAAQKAFDEAYARYRDLPEEFDAFFVEDKVQKGYLGSP